MSLILWYCSCLYPIKVVFFCKQQFSPLIIIIGRTIFHLQYFFWFFFQWSERRRAPRSKTGIFKMQRRQNKMDLPRRSVESIAAIRQFRPRVQSLPKASTTNCNACFYLFRRDKVTKQTVFTASSIGSAYSQVKFLIYKLYYEISKNVTFKSFNYSY